MRTSARKRILYVQYTNPALYPPLQHSSRILADDGWEVLFLGIGARGESGKIDLPPHPNVSVRRWRYQPPGLAQKLHYLAFLVWVLATAFWWRPAWIYASEFFAGPLVWLLSHVGFSVLYHEHDHPGSARGWGDAWLYKLRPLAARSCAAVVLPNETRRKEFVTETRRTRRTFAVWNAPARTEAEFVSEKSADAFVLFYHGSIVPARVPFSVLQAVAALPLNIRFEVAGYSTVGHETHLRDLQSLSESLQLGNRFRYLGALSRAALLPQTRRAHVGLSLMPMRSGDLNEEAMVGASNKPFEYLASGCALLVADLPAWQQMFVAPGFARACEPDDAGSIAANLRWFAEHPVETREMGEHGRSKVLEEWNYETQFAPVQQFLLSGET